MPKEARYTFYGVVDFTKATFRGRADFTNRRLGRKTSFTDAHFDIAPPLLSNAEMHPTTDWRRTSWPARRDGVRFSARELTAFLFYPWFPRHEPPPRYEAETVEWQADAYAQLRLRMNEIQDHDAEFGFFARELDAKRLQHWIAGRYWRAVVFGLYGMLSGYGLNLWRPLVGLRATIGVGGWVLHQFQGVCAQFPTVEKALGFSATNTIAFLGVRREIFPDVLKELPGWLQVLSVSQSILGAIFIFLLLLALRNRFRIR